LPAAASSANFRNIKAGLAKELDHMAAEFAD
jgi:hypothetical protein